MFILLKWDIITQNFIDYITLKFMIHVDYGLFLTKDDRRREKYLLLLQMVIFMSAVTMSAICNGDAYENQLNVC